MPTWRVLSVVSMLSPTPPIDILALTQAAARGLATAEKAKPGVMRVTVHLCPHAAGEGSPGWYNCKTDLRAQYEQQ